MLMSIGNIFWLFFRGALQMLQVRIYKPFAFDSIYIEKAVQSMTME